MNSLTEVGWTLTKYVTVPIFIIALTAWGILRINEKLRGRQNGD